MKMNYLRECICLLQVAFSLMCSIQTGASQTTLPTDAAVTCPDVAISLNPDGSISPPDTLAYLVSDCDFYSLAERTFLWVTSPLSPTDKSYIFDSDVFYQVSPFVGGKRSLVQNASGQIKMADIGISQLGSAGQAVVFDSTGRTHTYSHQDDRCGTATFRNQGEATSQYFTSDGRPIIADPSGNAIATQAGETCPTVLMAQGNRLVYYTIAVNDVYAYFLSATKPGLGSAEACMIASDFPTSENERHEIQDFAPSPFPDAGVLALELKAAWIEIVVPTDSRKYVTTSARIPTFDTSNQQLWVHNGWRPAQLALVGMHVSLSALDHPEMLWATFEHLNNTPNPAYKYNGADGNIRSHPADGGGTWLFSSGDVRMPERRRMYMQGNDIHAELNQTIGPSNVTRFSPWGASPDDDPSSNANIISINTSVVMQLPDGDVRRNYIMIGATWRSPGGAGGVADGTYRLANSAMETFSQPSNCLDCHQGNMVRSHGGGLSHIYGVTDPLPLNCSRHQ